MSRTNDHMRKRLVKLRKDQDPGLQAREADCGGADEAAAQAGQLLEDGVHLAGC